MAKPKTNTKAKKAAQEPSDDQKKSGAVAQTGAGETPAPALDTTEGTAKQAKTGADKNAAPVEDKPEAKGEADPSEVTKAVTSEADASNVSVENEAPPEAKGEAPPFEAKEDGSVYMNTEALSGISLVSDLAPASAPLAQADTSAAPRKLTPDENAELSRQIKGAPEELQNRHGPEGLEVTVVGPKNGFRRAGMRFGPEATTFGAEKITAKQLVALQETPELVVSLSEKPVAPSAD